MKNTTSKMMVALMTLSYSFSLYAGNGTEGGTGPTTNRTTTTKGTSSNAEKEAKRQQMGQTVSSITSTVLITKGTGSLPSPPGFVMIGLGIVAAVQAANFGASKGKTSGTVCDTTSGLSCKDFSMGDVSGSGNNSNAFNQIKRDLANAGVKLNDKDKSFTFGKKTYKPSDFTSAAAMKAAGFDDSTINSAMKEAQKIGAEAYEKAVNSVSGMAESDSGGGGGGSGSSGSSASSDGEGDLSDEALKNAMAKDKIDRDPASLSKGMSKYFGSDRIGVAGDSLFDMMNRRYNLKDKEGMFFKLDEGASSQK